jgi:creatinine amidohydrolase
VANFYVMVPDVKRATFELPGDHADEMETSLMLHLCPNLVELDQAGSGERVPFAIKSLSQPGIWTPRPWSKSHPDTGSGDPSRATAEKGKLYFQAVAAAISDLIVDLASAQKGQLPYL